MGGGYGTYSTPSPQGKLPILVGILAILIGIVGVLVLIAGLLALLIGLGILSGGPILFQTGGLLSSLVLVGAYYFLLGLIMAVVARGLWDCESWALWTTGFVVLLELLETALADEVVLAVIFLGLFVYLIAVRDHFT